MSYCVTPCSSQSLIMGGITKPGALHPTTAMERSAIIRLGQHLPSSPRIAVKAPGRSPYPHSDNHNNNHEQHVFNRGLLGPILDQAGQESYSRVRAATAWHRELYCKIFTNSINSYPFTPRADKLLTIERADRTMGRPLPCARQACSLLPRGGRELRPALQRYSARIPILHIPVDGLLSHSATRKRPLRSTCHPGADTARLCKMADRPTAAGTWGACAFPARSRKAI